MVVVVIKAPLGVNKFRLGQFYTLVFQSLQSFFLISLFKVFHNLVWCVLIICNQYVKGSMYVVPPLSPSTHFHYLLCTRRLLTQLHPIKNLFLQNPELRLSFFSVSSYLCGGQWRKNLDRAPRKVEIARQLSKATFVEQKISQNFMQYVYGPISIQFRAKLEENQSIGGGCKISVMVLEVMLLSWQLKRPRWEGNLII